MNMRDYQVEKRQRNAAVVEDLVEKLAVQKMAVFAKANMPPMSLAEAKTKVWLENPNYALAWRLASKV